MIVLAGIEPDLAAARRLAGARLDDGGAADRFARMVKALGGPGDFLERAANHLPAAPVIRAVYPERSGFIAGMNAREIGLTLVALGGGRQRPDDAIDLAVGLTDFVQVADYVDGARPLCLVHARNDAAFDLAAKRIRAAIRIADEPCAGAGSIVKERIARSP
jgi:thymidine phosphorylase